MRKREWAAMTANKHKIRAALCWNEEISELAKKHNNEYN